MATDDKLSNKIKVNSYVPDQNLTIEPKKNQLPNQAKPKTSDEPDFRKKSVTGKVIATVFSILLLIAGLAAGVLLVGQQQEIRERAAGDEECIESAYCEFIGEPQDAQVYEARLEITHVLIVGKDTRRFEPGVTDDGCLRVTISQNLVMWNRYDPGPNCPDISSIQIWLKAN